MWKNKKAAISITVDDSCLTYAKDLAKMGYAGTYYLDRVVERDVNYLISLNHEVGAHTHTHPYKYPSPKEYDFDIKINLSEINSCLNGLDCNSFAWPYGHTNLHLQEAASNYFTSARGYNLNQLETHNPRNFLNLKFPYINFDKNPKTEPII